MGSAPKASSTIVMGPQVGGCAAVSLLQQCGRGGFVGGGRCGCGPFPDPGPGGVTRGRRRPASPRPLLLPHALACDRKEEEEEEEEKKNSGVHLP
jgi:hypothetical protein